jgi:hypothetical protein
MGHFFSFGYGSGLRIRIWIGSGSRDPTESGSTTLAKIYDCLQSAHGHGICVNWELGLPQHWFPYASVCQLWLYPSISLHESIVRSISQVCTYTVRIQYRRVSSSIHQNMHAGTGKKFQVLSWTICNSFVISAHFLELIFTHNWQKNAKPCIGHMQAKRQKPLIRKTGSITIMKTCQDWEIFVRKMIICLKSVNLLLNCI